MLTTNITCSRVLPALYTTRTHPMQYAHSMHSDAHSYVGIYSSSFFVGNGEV